MSVWPAADWDKWPMTRYGALIIDAIVLVLCIAGWVGPHYFWKNKRRSAGPEVVYQRQYFRWGLWPCGLDTVETLSDNTYIIRRERCYAGCCCSDCSHALRPDDVIRVQAGHHSLWWGVLWALAVGCLVGIWLHFIPCIWWTCDWGANDGQGVRGGIWFACWAALFVILIVLHRTACAEVCYERHGRIHTIQLTVGGRGSFSSSGADALTDLEELRALFCRKQLC